MNSNIFRSLSYGVYVISTMDQERPTGCIVNSIMQITASPATVAASINHDNYTNPCIVKNGLFACSILSEQSDPSLIGEFGFCSGKDTDKFDGVDYEMVEGMPVLKDSCGYFICEVTDTMETETHTVFLGNVIEAEVYEHAADAMTYAYYHKVIKGKAPKNAPTYLPEPEERVSKWVCQICGYVYEGGEELPAGFICPVCGQGADKFKKIE